MIKKLIILVLLAGPILCESQTHEYLFNNNLNELNGGPGLTEILTCGAATGSYGVQTAGTTAGACLTFNSFCFNDGGGLQYANPGLITSSYTINVFFRFTTLGGYARVIDFSNSASDAGIYFLGNCLNLYPNGNVGTCPYFNTNTYYLITFVRDGGTNIISVYVDGTLFGTYTDSGNLYRPASAAIPINFFRDDNPVPCEAQPGCVKYISVSPSIATASDVAQTWANISTITQSTNAAPPIVTISPTGSFTCSNSTITLSASSSGTMVWNGGSLSNSSNPAGITSGGTYIVTATDANGCMDTAMVTVSANTTPPIVTAGSSGNLTCSVTSVTLTGNSLGNTMVWNGGSLSNAPNPATVTAAGTYTVTATDAINGCTNTSSVIVTSTGGQAIIAAVNSTTICNGQTTTLTATGGTTYSWSTGETTNSITVSPTTTTSYTVTGTTSGCSDDTIATVIVNPLPSITVNSPTICAGQTATLTASGATTYLWSTGATTNQITDNPTTNSSYTVTGTTGSCSNTAIADVTVGGSLSITVNSQTICAGQTATLTASGGTTYLWSTGATTNLITDTPLTTTSFTVTGTTSGCNGNAIATITVVGVPAITVNSPIICAGQTATLTASGGTTYLWSTGATTNQITDNPTTSTSYTVTGTTGSCSNTAIADVTVGGSLSITVNSQTICAGQTATLTASGGTTYLWSTGATTNPITDTPVTNTSYTVTGTTSGCNGNAIATITVVGVPAITVNLPIICAGQTATITASGGTTYLWSTGSTANPITVTPSAITSYTVTGTTSGCSDTAIATVTVNPLPVITVNSATICAGQTATLTAIGGTTYSWSTGATANSINVSPSTSTNYNVTSTTLACSSSAVSSVIVNPMPIVTVNSPSICYGGIATITANGASTYSWSTGATSNTISDSPISTTTYSVTGTSNGCSSVAVSTVTVNPYLSVNAIGATSICQGSSATITATAINGSGGPYTYSWAPQVISTGSSVTVAPIVTTTYTVTANDACSPIATDSVTVTVLPIPTVLFNADINQGCSPLCVNFTDLSTVVGGTIISQNWDFGAEGANPEHCFTNEGSYSILLTVTSNNGCTSSFTDTNMITVSPFPTASFSAPLSTGILDPTVNFSDNSGGASLWNWNFGDTLDLTSANISNIQNPSHTYSEVGTYCVNLIVGNIAGCYDTTQVCLEIDREFSFYIPNSFSPDGNDKNDEFFGKGENIKEFIMQIYDRWGNLLFYTDDIDKHWDGRINGGAEIVQKDVYVYLINIKDNKRKSHRYIGNVTVLN